MRVENFDGNYWQRRFDGARRVQASAADRVPATITNASEAGGE